MRTKKAPVSEIAKSRKRLGFTPLSHLKWILRFVQLDFDTISAGELLDTGWEYLALENTNPMATFVGGPRQMGAEKKASAYIESGVGELVPEGSPSPSSAEQMLPTQTALKWAINRFLGTGGVELSLSALTVRVQTLTPHHMTQQALFHYPCQLTLEMPEKEQWAFKLGFLLGVFGHGVRRCPECETIFLADRKDQICCQRRCVNRKAQRDFQKRKKAKLAKKTTSKKSKKGGK